MKTKRKILTYPNPYLREEAQLVKNFDDELQSLFNEMCTLMHESDGVGLAATQVGESLQLLVLSSYVFLPDEERKKISEDEEADMGEDLAVINPKILTQSKDEVIDYEGCLSFPEVYIKVKRPSWVEISAQNLRGESITFRGEGFGARAILHEMDHLNGKVMTDHLSFLAKQKALKDHQKIQKALAKKEAAKSETESQRTGHGRLKSSQKARAETTGKLKSKLKTKQKNSKKKRP